MTTTSPPPLRSIIQRIATSTSVPPPIITVPALVVVLTSVVSPTIPIDATRATGVPGFGALGSKGFRRSSPPQDANSTAEKRNNPNLFTLIILLFIVCVMRILLHIFVHIHLCRRNWKAILCSCRFQLDRSRSVYCILRRTFHGQIATFQIKETMTFEGKLFKTLVVNSIDR